jgi:hypothetical protein
MQASTLEDDGPRSPSPTRTIPVEGNAVQEIIAKCARRTQIDYYWN